MTIAPSDRPYFYHTQSVKNYIAKAQPCIASDRCDLAARVARVALGVLLFLPAVAADVAINTSRTIYAWCYPAPTLTAKLDLPNFTVPDNQLIEQVLQPPAAIEALDNPMFLKNAIQTALKFHTPDSKNNYKTLIRDQSVPDDGSIDIWRWSAGCLLARYLAYKTHRPILADQLYPKQHPDEKTHDRETLRQKEVLAHVKNLDDLWDSYQILSRKDRAAALLHIAVPATQWKLSEPAKQLVDKIHPLTLSMSQDPAFLKIWKNAVQNTSLLSS